MSDAPARLTAALADRYRIEREIGAGGMATVYLAEDLKHRRKVALKVLKPELAAIVGADRFLAEIQTTANLQHPHILPLFDSGQVDGFLFYVMPYVSGESLRDRLDREKQLPVPEAVRIATAVANALEHAHRLKVIHRDIKPENILLQDGEPVVADFGIALAVGTAGGGRLTETGLSLGTPFYMSPEQATGAQHIGPQADIYALGCVLYEMLVGEPPYAGTTAQAVLGKIIAGAPVAPAEQRPSIPPNVDAAIRQALEKLPADRFGQAQDFARALADPGFRYGQMGLAEARDSGKWKRIAAGLALTTLLATLGTAWPWLHAAPAPIQSVERFSKPFLQDQAPTFVGLAGFNLSPDGKMLVYRNPSAQGAQILWVRRWDAVEASPIRGSENSLSPAVSPDGKEVAFTGGDGEIRIVPLNGGAGRTLVRGSSPRWGGDGFVYASDDTGTVRVPATGGTAERLTRRGPDDFLHVIHGILPGGKTALITISDRLGAIEIRALDMKTREMTPIIAGSSPRYAPSGHLLFQSADGSLMAAPFDPAAARLVGPAVALLEDVGAYSISDDGKLFYSIGATVSPRELVWVTRTGIATPIDGAWRLGVPSGSGGGAAGNWGLSLSPNGTRLAVVERTEAGVDVWVKELDDGPRSRLTFAKGGAYMPSWVNDQTLTFLADHEGHMALWSQRADGTGAPELLVDAGTSLADGRSSPNGEWLLLRTIGTPGVVGGRDILALQRGRDSVPRPLLTREFDEVDPRVSPDGHWLAYGSTETGRYEVFVRPFPDAGAGKWQVSTNGGVGPLWAHNGQELFFIDSSRRLVAAALETASGFRVIRRDVLFEIPGEYDIGPISPQYDISRDDRRFVMSRVYKTQDKDPPNTILVQNFFEELKARVPR